MGQKLHPVVAIVDDDGFVRESLRLLLETAGCDVDTFVSAPQFLEFPHSERTTCLLVDQRMPNVTGLELLRRLGEQGIRIPTALMTGSPSADLTRQALALGAVAVMSKPMSESDLLRFVHRASR